MQSDQNGYAGIASSAAIALAADAMIPITRPNPPPENSENAANPCRTPITSVTHPQLLRLPKMYFWSFTKNDALSIAATP